MFEFFRRRHMAADFKYQLGDRVKDKVTKFTGIIVGRGDHISGCDTYGVQTETLKDGMAPGREVVR